MNYECINYIMPDFTCYSRNSFLLSLLENYQFVFKYKIKFHSFYGVFPGAIWNGGGYFFGYRDITIREMKRVRDYYNKRGIAITFTFTNQLITEEHTYDEYCNNMLKVFHNGMNEILVVSPILEKYIRENYPKYKINRSIINTEKVPFLLDNYHLTVLSKFKNKDFEFLKSLSEEERSRTELLCDELCINNCPYKYEHYKEYAYIQLHAKNPDNADKNYGQCRFLEEPYQQYLKRTKDSKYIISSKDIIETYIPLGFKYFKLSGRGTNNTLTLVKLVDYFFKKEYHNDTFVYMAEQMLLDFSKELETEFRSKWGTMRVDDCGWEYV